jgi:hypothetical protein
LRLTEKKGDAALFRDKCKTMGKNRSAGLSNCGGYENIVRQSREPPRRDPPLSENLPGSNPELRLGRNHAIPAGIGPLLAGKFSFR